MHSSSESEQLSLSVDVLLAEVLFGADAAASTAAVAACRTAGQQLLMHSSSES
jgi:hypothetical protein